jgi:hypothetical protein
VIFGLVAAATLSTSPVHASAPEVFGPFHTTGTFVGSECGFDVRIDFDVTETFTVFLDDDGEPAKIIYRVRAPRDVFTNVETGESVVVRGMFQESIERIPGTDQYTKEISGFRYLVNQLGQGVIIQEVGRVIYADLDQTTVLFQAGKHQLLAEEDFWRFCGLWD